MMSQPNFLAIALRMFLNDIPFSNYRTISHVPFRNLRGLDMLLVSNEKL